MEQYGMPTDSFSSCGMGRTGWTVASWSFSSSPASNPLTLPLRDGFTLTPLTRGMHMFTHEVLVCINRNSDTADLACIYMYMYMYITYV